MKKDIIVPVCWINGGNMIDRDTLPSDHPESVYGYIKNTLKLKPEDFGVYRENHDLMKEFDGKSREDLAQMIVEKRGQNHNILIGTIILACALTWSLT